jgi:hypothetical protein
MRLVTITQFPVSDGGSDVIRRGPPRPKPSPSGRGAKGASLTESSFSLAPMLPPGEGASG